MEELVKLTETFGSWGAIVLFTIYLIYQTIKDNNRIKKQKIEKLDEFEFKNLLKKQISKSEETNQEILKYLKIVTKKYIEEINESQARIIISSTINLAKFNLINYITKITEENNIITQKKEIAAKIKIYISNNFHKDNLSLKEFKHKEIELSNSLKKEWITETSNTIIELVLDQKNIKIIRNTIDNTYDGYKYSMLETIC